MSAISCIIPTYDRGSLLHEAIASAVRQSRPPEEIIVVNNGTQPVQIPPFLAGHVKVYDIVPHAGVSQARNFGAALASGDYFAFLDDDDLWDVGYLEVVAAAIARGDRLIVGRLDEFDEQGARPYKNAAGDLSVRTVLVRNPGVNGSNLVVERALFRELRGFDVRLPASEDKSFILEALLRQIPVTCLSEARVLLRSHSGSRLRTNSRAMADAVWQFARKYGPHMTTDELLLNVEKAYRHKKALPPSGDDESADRRWRLVLRLLGGASPDVVSGESQIAVDELLKWKRIGDRAGRLALIELFHPRSESGG
jgi:glycosyltransferase involved in cell wall biosynthesis